MQQFEYVGLDKAFLQYLFAGREWAGGVKPSTPGNTLLFASALIGDRVTIVQIIAILIDLPTLPEFL
jgi:hypothetical protein